MKSLSSLLAASLLSLLSLTSVGCTTSTPSRPVTMADSFDLDLFGPHVDDLHTPYVAGASFAITVSASSSQSQAGWSLSSSDPAVFRVESALSGGSANVTAVAPGQATLNVLNASGEVMDSHPISVAIPDQVNLYAEGLLVTGASDSAAQITQASIVAGGRPRFSCATSFRGPSFTAAARSRRRRRPASPPRRSRRRSRRPVTSCK